MNQKERTEAQQFLAAVVELDVKVSAWQMYVKASRCQIKKASWASIGQRITAKAESGTTSTREAR